MSQRSDTSVEVRQQTSYAILTDAQLATVIAMPPSAMKVYLVIRRAVGGRESWFISGGLEEIARQAGVSRRAAERAVGELEQANLISREHRTLPNGATASTRYTVIAPQDAPAEPPKRLERKKRKPRKRTPPPTTLSGAPDNTVGEGDPDNTIGDPPDNTIGAFMAPTTLSGPQRIKKKKKRIRNNPQPPHRGGHPPDTSWSIAQQGVCRHLQAVKPPTAYRAPWAEAAQQTVVAVLAIDQPRGLDELRVTLPGRNRHDICPELNPVADALHDVHGFGAWHDAVADQDAPSLLAVRIARTIGFAVRQVVNELAPRERRREFLAQRLSAEVDAALQAIGIDCTSWPEDAVPESAVEGWTPPTQTRSSGLDWRESMGLHVQTGRASDRASPRATDATRAVTGRRRDEDGRDVA